MGGFNLARSSCPVECPVCHTVAHWWIQFHFGEKSLARYTVGEHVVWGGGERDEGMSDLAHVLVQGFAEGCRNCDYSADAETWVVELIYDQLVRVERSPEIPGVPFEGGWIELEGG